MSKVPEKCSRCGAPIGWEEGASTVKCDFCGYKNTLKPDFYNLFISYLKLRNPKEIITHPISRIILLLLIPLFLIINPKTAKEEKGKEDYWPAKTKSKEFKKVYMYVSPAANNKKALFPFDKAFKEELEMRTVKFQPDVKQACIYRKSLQELISEYEYKRKSAKYKFNIRLGNLPQVFDLESGLGNAPDIPTSDIARFQEIRNEFGYITFNSDFIQRNYFPFIEPGLEFEERDRQKAISNFRYIMKAKVNQKTRYIDYYDKEFRKWEKEIGAPLWRLKVKNKVKLFAAEVEVLRQSGYEDWKLYSRWNESGIGDLHYYYWNKWREAGNPKGGVYKFALKNGALKKSDFNEWGTMKYKWIPSVIKDICKSY